MDCSKLWMHQKLIAACRRSPKWQHRLHFPSMRGDTETATTKTTTIDLIVKPTTALDVDARRNRTSLVLAICNPSSLPQASVQPLGRLYCIPSHLRPRYCRNGLHRGRRSNILCLVHTRDDTDICRSVSVFRTIQNPGTGVLAVVRPASKGSSRFLEIVPPIPQTHRVQSFGPGADYDHCQNLRRKGDTPHG